jgi:hypothetical protein
MTKKTLMNFLMFSLMSALLLGFQNCQKAAEASAQQDQTVTSANGQIKCTPNNCVCNGGITYNGCGGSTVSCNGDSIVCPTSKSSAFLMQQCKPEDLDCAVDAELASSAPEL